MTHFKIGSDTATDRGTRLQKGLGPVMAARMLGASFCLVGSLLFVSARAADLPRARPESVGMSSERLARITATFKAAVDANTIPGAVLLVSRQGKVVYYETVGRINPEVDAPMSRDTIFRIHSMTKPLTTVAAMMLVEEGRLNLNDPVSQHIPAFGKVQVGVEKPDANGGAPTLELVPVRRPLRCGGAVDSFGRPCTHRHHAVDRGWAAQLESEAKKAPEEKTPRIVAGRNGETHKGLGAGTHRDLVIRTGGGGVNHAPGKQARHRHSDESRRKLLQE